ncbi:MAG: hypothetical protein AB8B94_12465 [Hyphomicrobiales bacterium]
MFSLKALILYVLFFVIGWLLARWLWNKKQSEISHHSTNTNSSHSSAATASASSAPAMTTTPASAEVKDDAVSAKTEDTASAASKSTTASKSSTTKSKKAASDVAPVADKKTPKPSTTKEAAKDVVEETAESATPELLKAPRDGEADDLKKIKGIGKKNEEKLNGFGVYHFDQIANWSDEQVKWIGVELAFSGRIERENWIDQANVLASGGDTEFSRRVDKGKVSSSKS